MNFSRIGTIALLKILLEKYIIYYFEYKITSAPLDNIVLLNLSIEHNKDFSNSIDLAALHQAPALSSP